MSNKLTKFRAKWGPTEIESENAREMELRCKRDS